MASLPPSATEQLQALGTVFTADQMDGLAYDWAAFIERTGTADRDMFVQYLQQQGLIDQRQLAQALTLRVGLDVGTVEEVLAHAKGEAKQRLTYASMSPNGHYALLGHLGEGSTGFVQVAKDHDLRRKVAYKGLTGRYADDEVVRQRFLAEVQITAQLDHPNIVPVYSLEASADGRMGYAMKLVQGDTLDELMRLAKAGQAGPYQAEHRRIELFLKVCDAVHYAHSKGVLHRDLKPDNIMVGRFGEAYVMDWGLARRVDETSEELPAAGTNVAPKNGRLTRVGTAVGTPAYMSPEQAMGKNTTLDARSDQYALGLILQELVCLGPATREDTAEKMLVGAARAQRLPLRDPRGRPIDKGLAAVIDKACSRDREQRYPSVAAMSDDLRRWLRDEPLEARPEGIGRRLLRAAMAYRELALALGLLSVVGGSAIAFGSLAAFSLSERAHSQREDQLARAVASLSERAHVIDKEVLRWERMLEAVASAAMHALRDDDVTERDYVLATDFDDPATAPADVKSHPRYGRPVSLEHLSFKLAPGTFEVDVGHDLRRLANLDNVLPAIVARALDDVGERFDDAPSPIGWIYVGTPAGVHASYPGHGGYDPSFDPRKRPWYELSAQTDPHLIHWGNPYRDASGLGLILPCSKALVDEDEQFLGVAGMDITFGYLIRSLLVPTDLSIDEAFLLDDQGRIVVRSEGPQTEDAGALALEQHPDPMVVADVLAGRSGTHRADGRLTMVFPLRALGWWYVVTADEAELLRAE